MYLYRIPSTKKSDHFKIRLSVRRFFHQPVGLAAPWSVIAVDLFPPAVRSAIRGCRDEIAGTTPGRIHRLQQNLSG